MAAPPAAENHMLLNTITRGLVEHNTGQTSHCGHQMAMWLWLPIMNWLMSDASSHKYRWPKQWSIIRGRNPSLKYTPNQRAKTRCTSWLPCCPPPLTHTYSSIQGFCDQKIVCTDICQNWMEIFYRFIQWWAWKTRENSINEQNIVPNTLWKETWCWVEIYIY